MKVSASLAAFAALTSTAAATNGTFSLTDLVISGSRFGSLVYYSFNVVEEESQASTSCSMSTSLNPKIIFPFSYVPCGDPAFSFAWQYVDGLTTGWGLQITRQPESGYLNQTSCTFFDDSKRQTIEDPFPNWTYERMDIPEDLDVQWQYQNADQCSYP